MILILSPENDLHSITVQKALTLNGIDSLIFDTSSISLSGSVNFTYQTGKAELSVDTGENHFHLNDVSTVWQRRPFFPVIPSIVAKEDKKFAWQELKTATDSIYQFLSNAFWVNPRQSRAITDTN
ncbi:hypothetical protein DXX93_02840 [Thalassotalea euphylliae]|uniref:MvdD-like pre-ATP grasp domain-containing protein n=1 Tax=Thalassotalea euphylliae TaxID=1655234 RepID=A0A3E0TM73_9GAMM|nr:hypothetical protein [Thalassotalea euphylliae]REL25588.1 hypothetical protein DXX93_02840 [Thalassotalea euphylliae]